MVPFYIFILITYNKIYDISSPEVEYEISLNPYDISTYLGTKIVKI